jgi:hypothetical protein
VRISRWDGIIVAGNVAVNLLRISNAAMGQGFENVNVARSLFEGHGFANPFQWPTGPTAHVAPAYPGVLWLLLRVFGNGPAFGVAATLLDLLLQTAALLLLPRLAERLWGRAEPGYWAAGLMLLANAPSPQTETSLAALACTALVLATESRRAGAAAGWMATAALTNPALCPPAVLASLSRFPWRKAAWIAAAGLAAAAPWVIRNRVELGAWSPVRDNFGLELWVSNGKGAAARAFGSGTFFARHPMHSEESAARMRHMGEAAFNRAALRDAAGWAARNPGAFARLTAERVWLYWFPEDAWEIWIITLLSLGGLWAARSLTVAVRCRAQSGLALLWPFLVVYPLPYYLVQAMARYRYPALWVSALLAGYAISRVRWRVLYSEIRAKQESKTRMSKLTPPDGR